MRKTNKILVSAAVCGILSVTLGTGVSAEYLPSFVTTTTTATATEDITDEITDTDIPADSIIDIVEETTISTEVISETTIPVTDLFTGDEISSGALTEKTDTDDISDIVDEDEIAVPAGNGILLEDVSGSEINRQFITVQSKGGNTFYIVIDKDMKGNENVYFMNLVDEYDLLAFSEDFPEGAPVKKTSNDKKTDTADTGKDTDDTESESTEKPEDTAKPEAGGNNTIILLVGGALLIGGGAFYYFKIYKGGKAKAPKKVVPDDDEEDETEFDDPNDAVRQETNDSDE